MNKKGIFRVLVFLIALIVCDSVMGMVARMLFYSQKSGKYARLTYTVKTDTSAIVVLGSSHALAHFIPDMIQDSLHESAFNYGANGQKLLFSRALYEIRKRRSEPAMVLLNVDADWFFDKRSQEERMSDLYPYYDLAGDIILRDFSSRDRFIERLKFLSRTFPYNSTIVHVIRYKLKPQHDFNGYEPLFGAVDSAQLATVLHSEKKKTVAAAPQPDGELMGMFTQFISEMQKDRIKLIVVFSPELLKPDKFERSMYERIRNVCDSTGTALLDFSTSGYFNNNRLLFHDLSHLDDSGARIFTGMLIDSIKLRPAVSESKLD
ncbi:MAG TPA: hypothetical protein VGR89_14980 [Puia sp.]|nr:hypothetical protein [Puia sp.]